MKTRIKKKFQLKKINVANVSITQNIYGGNNPSSDPANPKCGQITNTTTTNSRVELACNNSDAHNTCD